MDHWLWCSHSYSSRHMSCICLQPEDWLSFKEILIMLVFPFPWTLRTFRGILPFIAQVFSFLMLIGILIVIISDEMFQKICSHRVRLLVFWFFWVGLVWDWCIYYSFISMVFFCLLWCLCSWDQHLLFAPTQQNL